MAAKRKRKNRYKTDYRKQKKQVALPLAPFFQCIAVVCLTVVLSVTFIFGYDVLTQCDFFKAQHIQVEGNHFLTPEQVLEGTGLHPGINILSVNLNMVRNHLLTNPVVEDAAVGRELPDTLRITIKEHVPLAILDLDRKFLVNLEGEIYKELEPTDPLNLPVVRGLTFADIKVKDKLGSPSYQSVMDILRIGLAENSILPISRIRQIHVDREIGLTLFADNVVGAIKIGYRDYRSKLMKLNELIMYMNTRGRFTRLNSVDLINLNRIVVTPAEAPPSANEKKEV